MLAVLAHFQMEAFVNLSLGFFQGGRSQGSALAKFSFAFGLALALAGALPSAAWAKPGFAIVKLTAAQFVSNCQSMGGTSSSAPGGGVRCTLPSGTVVDCSFSNDGTALCQWTKTLPPASIKGLMGDPLPNTMNPGTIKPQAPGAPAAPGTLNSGN
jgi:hypothetical protein